MGVRALEASLLVWEPREGPREEWDLHWDQEKGEEESQGEGLDSQCHACRTGMLCQPAETGKWAPGDLGGLLSLHLTKQRTGACILWFLLPSLSSWEIYQENKFVIETSHQVLVNKIDQCGLIFLQLLNSIPDMTNNAFVILGVWMYVIFPLPFFIYVYS